MTELLKTTIAIFFFLFIGAVGASGQDLAEGAEGQVVVLKDHSR